MCQNIQKTDWPGEPMCQNVQNSLARIFRCTVLYDHFSIAIILMGERELVALLGLSSWCLVMVEGLFLAVPWDVCGL